MAEGGEPCESKPVCLSEEDEEKMVDYLTQTGRYDIRLTPVHIPKSQGRGRECSFSTPKRNLSYPPVPPSPLSTHFHSLYAPASPTWPVYQQPPRISTFSGEDPVPKGETSFESWKFEVRCLMRDDTYSPATLLQAVRKSLRGDAARLLVSLGEDATVMDILQRLESPYGTVDTAENLLQEFHQAVQRENESLASWAIRLEDILQHVMDTGTYFDSHGKNALLRNRFWTGLRNSHLKDATRHVFYSATDFGGLMQTVRVVEQEIGHQSTLKQKPLRTQHHPQQTGSTREATAPDQLSEVMKRLEKLETEQKKPSTDNQILQQILERLTVLESYQKNPPQEYTVRYPRARGRGRGGRGGRGQSRGVQTLNYTQNKKLSAT